MVHFAPCWNGLGAQEFAQILREVFAKHGIPEEIGMPFPLSLLVTQFTSGFYKEASELLGLKRALSSSQKPQSDGQTERANRTLEDRLRHSVSLSQDDWDFRLPCCEVAINNAWNQAIDNTPFFLNYGEHPCFSTNVDVSGQHVWMKPPFTHIESFIKHYTEVQNCCSETNRYGKLFTRS